MTTNSVARNQPEFNPQAAAAYIERLRANVPAEMLDHRQWLLWRLEPVPNKPKPTKKPYNPHTGQLAETDNPATHGTFDEAAAAYMQGGYSGLGFVFTDGDSFCGIDFDDDGDGYPAIMEGGNLRPDVARHVKALNSYTERSQSGKGIHVIVHGRLPEGGRKSKKHGVEMYDTLRYFAMTGDVLGDRPAPIRNRQAQLEAMHAEVFGKKTATKTTATTAPTRPTAAIPADDDALWGKMFGSTHGQEIRSLYDGDLSAHSTDASAADLALCNHLAFWTGKDAGRMDRMFRQTRLFRDKWDRNARHGETYGAGTIARAIAGTAEIYSNGTGPTTAVTADDNPGADAEPPAEGNAEGDGKKAKKPLSERVRWYLTDRWGYTFGENELDDTVLVNGKPIDEATRAEIRLHARDAGFGERGKPIAAVEEMYTVLARRNRFHPVRDWLDSLVWDGEPHLAHFVGHFKDDHPPIAYPDGTTGSVFGVFFYRWALGAVARVYEGGKVQNPMLAWDGGQGLGKSYCAHWLASPLGGNYFIEEHVDPHSADHARYLATKWIWEVGELGSTVRRADRDALKRFITQTNTTFRVPYAKDSVVKPVLANFIGTVNAEDGFLTDPTGNRRFLSVHVTGINRKYSTTIDPAQLWAQIRDLYRKGERPQLHALEEEKRNAINATYQTPTDEREAILKYYDIDRDNSDWHSYTIDIVEDLAERGFKTTSTKKVGTALRELLGCQGKEIRRDGRRGVGYTGIRSKGLPLHRD